MKHFTKLIVYSSLFFFIGFWGTLEAQNLTGTIVSTNETCQGNGSITVNMSNVDPNATLSFALLQSNDTVKLHSFIPSSGATEITDVFNTLPHGDYIVKVKEEVNSVLREWTSGTISVLDEVEYLNFVTTLHNEACQRNIEVIHNSGNPVTYSLQKMDGTLVVPWQTSNILVLPESIPGGDYKVLVKDDCEQIKVEVESVPNEYGPDYYIPYCSLDGNILADCYTRREKICLGYSNSRGIKKIPQERFPITVNVEVENPNGGNPHTQTIVWNYSDLEYSDGEPEQVIEYPFYSSSPTGSYQIKTTYTDACGKGYSKIGNIVTKRYAYLHESNYEDGCAIKKNLSLRMLNLYGNAQILFEDYPEGFKPSDYNSNFTGDNTSCWIWNDFDPLYFGVVPEGQYAIKVVSCNDIIRDTINIEWEAKPQDYIVHAQERFNCDADKAAIKINVRRQGEFSYLPMTHVRILQAPTAFETQFGSLSYNATDYVEPTYERNFSMKDLPFGYYKFRIWIHDDCNNTDKVLEKAINLQGKPHTLVQNSIILDEQIDHSFNVTASVQTTYNNSSFYLQKFYPEEGKWGKVMDNPSSANFYNEGDDLSYNTGLYMSQSYTGGNSYCGIKNYTLAQNGITQGGEFRIIVRSLGEGNAGHSDICINTLEPFTIVKVPLTIDDYYLLQCPTIGIQTSTLLITATGKEPLKYRIIKKDGVPTNTTDFPETDTPIFPDLDATSIYVAQVEDAYGNTKVLEVSANEARMPLMKRDEFCVGDMVDYMLKV